VGGEGWHKVRERKGWRNNGGRTFLSAIKILIVIERLGEWSKAQRGRESGIRNCGGWGKL